MAEAGQVFVNFGANTQGLLAGTARAGNILQRFSQTGVGAALVMGASFVTLSRMMTGFATAAVSGFKDFDYHIVRAKALSSATTAEFQKMRGTAEELGRTTEFMAKDVAAGMSNLALAGFKANEIIKMIPTSLRLATAGGVNLAKTNTIMANAMRAFNLEANEADRVSNALTATFTTTNTTLESLAQTLKNAAGVLSVVGVEIEEVVAAGGVLGDVGINASVAGTGLKNFGIKLAKTFGIMKDGAKSAKEFFESLGVTKDRLFDAETGTLKMVDATIAFKEAMDTLGKARSPEFLAQFSKLFGARAAASIAQLVKNAEKYKMQVENTRMTGMVGDVQRVVESMRELGNQTAYFNEEQKGISRAIEEDLIGALQDANLYLSEFVDGGRGAAGAIDSIAKSASDTQKILEQAFGKGKFPMEDGMLSINEYSKDNAKEMYRLGQIIDELSKKNIGTQRRQQLLAEKAAYEKLVVSGTKSIEEITKEGRARLLNMAALKKNLDMMSATDDGRSKAANQLVKLNQLYQGNAKNVAMAAQAFGIQLKAGEKLGGGLENVEREMSKLTFSTDSQRLAFSRLMSQTATTNTALNMQAIQLETLDGIIKIFRSGLERVSNAIASALAPALAAGIQSVTKLTRAMTLSTKEIEQGVTAGEKLKEAWVDIIAMFTEGEGVFNKLKKSFEGLSSIGQTVAMTVGALGAAGLMAGGAFIWVQALLPALVALSGVFFTLVAPLVLISTVLIKVGIEFKKLRDQAREFGDEALDRTKPLTQAFFTFRDAVRQVKEEFAGMGDRFAEFLGFTEQLNNIAGGKLIFFGGEDKQNVIELKKQTETLEKALEQAGIKGKTSGDAIMNAYAAGDMPKLVKLLDEAGMKSDELKKAMGVWGVATAAQQKRFQDLNTRIKEAHEQKKSLTKQMETAKKEITDSALLEERMNELTEKQNNVQKVLSKRLEERKALQDKLVARQGEQGKLTTKELERLGVLKKKIQESSDGVGAMKRRYEELLGTKNKTVAQEEELKKLASNLAESHKVLVKHQKEYNSILDKAVSRNPFDIMQRAISKITESDEFKKFIEEASSMMADMANFVATSAIPKIIDVVGKMFKVLRLFINNVGPGIVAVIRSIGYVFGQLFSAVMQVFSEIFGGVAENKNAFKGLNDVLLAVAVGMRKMGDLAARAIVAMIPVIKFVVDLFKGLVNTVKSFVEGISNMDTDKLKEMGIIGGVIAAGFLGIKGALGLISSLGGALHAMQMRADNVAQGFARLFGITEKGAAQAFKPMNMLSNGLRAIAKFVMTNISAVLLWVGIAIAAAGAIFEAFRNNFGNVRQTGMAVLKSIWDLISTVFSSVWKLLGKAMSLIGAVIKTVWNIGKALAPLVGIVLSIVFAVVTPVIKIVTWLVKSILGLVSWVIGLITNILNSEFVQQLINTVGMISLAIHDVIMGIANFVKMAVGWILDFISPVTNWIGDMISKIWGVVKWLWDRVWGMIQTGWSIIVEYLMNFMRAIQGVATIVSGIFTWDIAKVREGLAMVFEGIAGMAIKIYEFVSALWAKLIGLIAEGLGNLIAGALGKFQGLADLLGFGDKVREMQEGIKNFGQQIGQNMEKQVQDNVNKMQEGVTKVADMIRGPQEEIEEGKKKAEDAIGEGEGKRAGAEDAAKEKAEKQDIKDDIGRQTISDLKLGVDKLNENTGKIAEGRQNNVTNNTYVEYRAAEDDEVNRRMLERVMNDILKADVGAVMGDTSGLDQQGG